MSKTDFTKTTVITDIFAVVEAYSERIVPVVEFKEVRILTRGCKYRNLMSQHVTRNGVVLESLSDVEKGDLRVGDTIALRIKVLGEEEDDVYICEVRRYQRTKNLPEWVPPTKRSECRGEIEYFGRHIEYRPESLWQRKEA